MIRKKWQRKGENAQERGTHGGCGVSEVARSMGEDTIAILSKAKMRCGGCGSKIGASILREYWRVCRMRYTCEMRCWLEQAMMPHWCVLRRQAGRQEVLVHTLDYFRSFVGDPYVFGKIAANHSLSDVHAMNGRPLTALALCVVPYGPEVQS